MNGLKRCFIFLFALLVSEVCFGQAAIPPQLKLLLDFYFRGPGSSNSVDRIQIKEGAIDLSRLDIQNVSGFFASRAYVQNTFVSNSVFNSYTNYANIYTTTNEAIEAVKTDPAWKASNWDAAYGWGDHSLAGYSSSSSQSTLSNYVTSTFVSNSLFSSYSNHVDSTFVSNSFFSAYSNHVDSTFVSNTTFNSFSNHVGSTFVSNSLLSTYFTGTIDIESTLETNRLEFENGLLKAHTLNP